MQPLALPLLAMPLVQPALPIHCRGPACPTQATLPARSKQKVWQVFLADVISLLGCMLWKFCMLLRTGHVQSPDQFCAWRPCYNQIDDHILWTRTRRVVQCVETGGTCISCWAPSVSGGAQKPAGLPLSTSKSQCCWHKLRTCKARAANLKSRHSYVASAVVDAENVTCL